MPQSVSIKRRSGLLCPSHPPGFQTVRGRGDRTGQRATVGIHARGSGVLFGQGRLPHGQSVGRKGLPTPSAEALSGITERFPAPVADSPRVIQCRSWLTSPGGFVQLDGIPSAVQPRPKHHAPQGTLDTLLNVTPLSGHKRMEGIEAILRELGYTREWLEAGVVDEECLRQQYEEYLHSDDKDQEHYRAGAFSQFLQNKDSLSDAELEAILHLRDEGPDGCDLSEGRILGLLYSHLLSDEQHEELSRYFLSIEPGYENQYVRERIARRMWSEGLTDEVCEDIKGSSDSVLHRGMLEHEEVDREHLLWLEEHGGNKAIRNRARQMLNSRRFRNATVDDND